MTKLSYQDLFLLNQYSQNLLNKTTVYNWFEQFNEVDQKDVLREIWGLALQSQLINQDVLMAIKNSGLKDKHTPARILLSEKESLKNRGYRLLNMKGKEMMQSFQIVLECFAIAARRKRRKCQMSGEKCSHWWHQDLSKV